MKQLKSIHGAGSQVTNWAAWREQDRFRIFKMPSLRSCAAPVVFHFSSCWTTLSITVRATVSLTAALVAIFILSFHFKRRLTWREPPVSISLFFFFDERRRGWPEARTMPRLHRRPQKLKKETGKRKREWILNKPRSLRGSQPGSHRLYPSHLVRLEYLTRDKNCSDRAKRSAGLRSRATRTLLPQQSAASKWWRQENSAAKMLFFFSSTTSRGTRSHKHVQDVNQRRIDVVGMVTISWDGEHCTATDAKEETCSLYFTDAGCQISEQVGFLRGEKSESISAQSFPSIRST